MTSDAPVDDFGRVMAEQYAYALRPRIARLPGRRVHCERLSPNDLAYPRDRPYDPRD